jgi:hypothetical protein
MTSYTGTLRPNYLRQRLNSRPPREGRFAVVCPKCSFKWYFQSDWEALQYCAVHEHRRPAVFVYSFIPTKTSSTGLTLYEHVWVELVASGEIHLAAV